MADLSKLIGKSESYIRNSLRLSTLPNKVKGLVKSGKISASHARTLAVAENAEELADKIMKDGLSVEAVGELVKSAPRSGNTKRAGRKKNTEYPAESLKKIEQELEDMLSLKAKLSVRANGAGTLSLKFSNIEQIEILTETLKTVGKKFIEEEVSNNY